MKKQLFLLLFLAGGFAGCDNHRAELRKSYIENCDRSATAQVTDSRIVPLLHDYCECSAEQLLNKMSNKELDNLEDPDSNPAIREKILNITAPCLKELQAKSAKLAR